MTKLEPRPTRRTRTRREESPKPAIELRLLAAMERLLEKGHRFGALTVEQLAEEADMGRATFYLHFRDKAELVTRLMVLLTEEVVQSTGTWFRNAKVAERRDVQAALAGVVTVFKKHHAIVAAMNDTAPYDENVAAQYHKMVDTICIKTRESMRTIKKQGLGRKGGNDDVADVLSWMVVLYCARFVGERNGASLGRLAQSLGHICTNTAFADNPS